MAILVKKLDRQTDVLKRLKFYVRPVTFGNVDGFETIKLLQFSFLLSLYNIKLVYLNSRQMCKRLCIFIALMISIAGKDVICLLNV